jgi:hypothetical protein
VHLHATEQRAAVKPSGGDYSKERWTMSTADFASRVPVYEPKYADALRQVLRGKGLTCEVGQGTAFALAFMFEFRYRCSQ